MAYHYDTEYNVEEQKEKAYKSIAFRNEQIAELESFISKIKRNNIQPPEEAERALQQLLNRHMSHIAEEQQTIEKCNRFLVRGITTVDSREWH